MYQQSNLTGGYYGPPIPAAAPPPKRRFCRCSVCCCLLSTIVSLVVIFGIFVLVIWLVFHPKIIKVAVEDVKLNNFTLATNTNTLTYNLATNISITNPNTKIGVYYDYLEAGFFYNGWRFDYTPLHTFYQGTRDTQYLSNNITGSATVSSVDSKYNSDKNSGFYDIEMRIYGSRRLKVAGSAGSSGRMRVRCEFRVHSSSASTRFQRTECDVVKF